jgi:hypothetical protein
MNRQNSLNRLYLNSYRVVHERVETVAVVQLEFVVEHRHDLFGHNSYAGFP